MVFATCFNGYDAGIMTVILADSQFTEYYHMNANRQGIVSTAPWATTGLAQLFLGGTLAHLVGRLWALRISILFMCLGVYVCSRRSFDWRLTKYAVWYKSCRTRSEFSFSEDS